MSIIAMQLDYQYRDFPCEIMPHIAEQLKAIEAAGCYLPRWHHAPANADQVITAAKPYLRFTMEVQPGSYLLGIKHNIARGFLCNITDIGLNHSFFSDPVPDSYFLSGGSPTVNPGQLTYWFKSPYPVVSPGRFIVEFWNTSTSESVTAELVIAVAEIIVHPLTTNGGPNVIEP